MFLRRKSKSNASEEDVVGERLYVRVDPCSPPSRTEGNDPIYGVVHVNDDANPILINNDYMTGQAVFRVKDFRGWTPLDERTGQPKAAIKTSPYFEGHRRTFSLQV